MLFPCNSLSKKSEECSVEGGFIYTWLSARVAHLRPDCSWCLHYMPKVLAPLLAEIARFSFSWPLSPHIVPYYSTAYAGLLYMIAGFQGKNGSCKASYRLDLESTDHSCHVLLTISSHRANQKFKGRKKRLYHLTIKLACVHKNGRNCWHPSLHTIYHSSQRGFRLPSPLRRADSHPITVSTS